jgi:hypothetical protein
MWLCTGLYSLSCSTACPSTVIESVCFCITTGSHSSKTDMFYKTVLAVPLYFRCQHKHRHQGLHTQALAASPAAILACASGLGTEGGAGWGGDDGAVVGAGVVAPAKWEVSRSPMHFSRLVPAQALGYRVAAPPGKTTQDTARNAAT